MDDCGCEKRVVMPPDAKPEMVMLEAHEHAMHTAGVKQGHGETMRQMADQLRGAAAKYTDWLAEEDGDGVPRWARPDEYPQVIDLLMAGYGSFAEQVEAEAGNATADACQQIGRAIALKKVRTRSVARRARDAWRAAVGGWRGG